MEDEGKRDTEADRRRRRSRERLSETSRRRAWETASRDGWEKEEAARNGVRSRLIVISNQQVR